jgi:hypothetical protein
MLGVRAEAGMRTFIKGHAARLGLDLSHLSVSGPKPTGQIASLAELPYAPEHLRRTAPALAMTWFIARGCTPALPIEPEPYDLLVRAPDGFWRVQVKSTTFRSPKGYWGVKVGHGSGGKRNTEGVIPYDHEEIDLFFIVDGDLNLYLIPSIVLAGRVGIAVDAYEKFRVGNAAGVLRLGELN